MKAWDPRGDASTYLLSTYDWTDICHGIALSSPLLFIVLIAAMYYQKCKRPIILPLIWSLGACVIYALSLYVSHLLSESLFADSNLYFLFDGRKILWATIVPFIVSLLITIGMGLLCSQRFAADKYPIWFVLVAALIPFQFVFFAFFPYLLGAS